MAGEQSSDHSDGGARPPPATLGAKGLVAGAEFVRVIVQSLHSLGYRRAAAALELESGVRLDSPEYAALLLGALAGRWDDCVAAIDAIGGLESGTRAAAAFLVWKEHFLELLGLRDGMLTARGVLAERIAPLDLDRRKVHRLAGSIISSEGVVKVEDRVKRRLALLLDLVEVMPPSVRAPAGRLEHLVETAVLNQTSSCVYHNAPDEVTLYEDHECSQEHIPSKCKQTLLAHENEVWFVQFSHNGDYLASSSKDCTAIIWMVNDDDSLSLKHVLKGHLKAISFVAWSPDDTMLLTCGIDDEGLKLWDIHNGTCKLTFSCGMNHVISSCAWFPNSEKIICGSCFPDNRIFTCDLEGHELEVWAGERMPKVSYLAVTPDGQLMVSICSNKEIWIRDFLIGKERVIHEEQMITSLSLSSDGQLLIVNLNSEIHLWKPDGSLEVPITFKGHKQEEYYIRSCFGGSDSLFVASGSEDSQVYIWNRHHEAPITVLSGHSKTVNCVSWNPTRPHILASASDDQTVRIWVANRRPTKVDAAMR